MLSIFHRVATKVPIRTFMMSGRILPKATDITEEHCLTRSTMKTTLWHQLTSVTKTPILVLLLPHMFRQIFKDGKISFYYVLRLKCNMKSFVKILIYTCTIESLYLENTSGWTYHIIHPNSQGFCLNYRDGIYCKHHETWIFHERLFIIPKKKKRRDFE